jgi:subtilisin family serine protease
MRLRNLLTTISILLLAISVHAQQPQFLLTSASPETAQDICSRHGLNFVATAWSSYADGRGVYLVSAPAGSTASSVQSSLSTDSLVFAVEQVQSVVVPELAGATLAQSTTGLLDTSSNPQLVDFFGSLVPLLYNFQPATSLIRSNTARRVSGLSGAGLTVAVIDTGIDPTHPVFSSVLRPGFDFTRNTAGSASELADLDPDNAAVLAQSTTGLLDGLHLVQVSGFAVAILAQSTTGLLDSPGLSAFGHGTMTAGVIHVVAPAAKIMPLKAFRADGTSDTYNIVRAIYFAAESGVNIISMSFEIGQSSPALEAAIHYAQSKGIVLVASAGNDGFQTQVFPAAMGNVIGVGSTNPADVRSTFSNFGSPDVLFAAPGEGVITSYPGGHYAAGWGTSFSAPLVTGSVALILQHNFQNNICGFSHVVNPLSKAIQVPKMGHGRIDLLQVVNNFSNSGSGGSKCTGVVYPLPTATDDDNDDD